MTLTRFLTDYVYIPLGGNRRGEIITLRNIMITFLISGIWHGVGWNFVFWGFIHGIAMVIQRLWSKLNISLHSCISWFLTFNFINIAWIFFRASDWNTAIRIIETMFGMGGLVYLDLTINTNIGLLRIGIITLIILGAFLWKRNTNEWSESFTPTRTKMILLIVIIVLCILSIYSIPPKGFVYNDF
jgi:alginate O-acetyltransferase complex protein AlgI